MAKISKIAVPGVAEPYDIGTLSIPFGQVDSTSTDTAYTAQIEGITSLYDGVCVYLKNGVITSNKNGFTLNINSLGAKPVYDTLAAATRSGTVFNVDYTMLFVYNSSRVSGGCWDIFYGYNSDTTDLEEALTPLTGTTETLTPMQVYNAIKSGKSVVLQHTNSQFGLFTFASFNIFEGQKVVVSTSIVKTGDAYLVGSLVGDAGSNNEWIFNSTEMAEAADIPEAVNNALAQAKASGEFDGADGKSAYAYAQDGGYTGTETEFAAKLAKEKFANPYALTFTGAVNETYDGSSAKTIEIPSGGGGGGTNLSLVYENTFENIAGINETIDALNGKENFVFNIEFTPLADSTTAVTMNNSFLYNGERRFHITYYLKFGLYSSVYPKKAIYGSVLKLGEGLWERIVLKNEDVAWFGRPLGSVPGKNISIQYLKDDQYTNRAAGLTVDFDQTVESVKVQIYAG